MRRIREKARCGGYLHSDHLSDFSKPFMKKLIKLSEKALALNDIEGAGTLPMEAN